MENTDGIYAMILEISVIYLTREVECVRLKQERFNAFDLLRE